MTSERRSPRSNGSDERPLVDVAEFSRGCYRVVFSSSKTARRSPSPSRCLSVPGHKPCNDEIRTVTDRFQATKVYRFATVSSQLGKDPSHRLSPPPVDFCLPWREDGYGLRPNGLTSVHSSESLSLCRGWCYDLGGF
jgi:hypothetical protein